MEVGRTAAAFAPLHATALKKSVQLGADLGFRHRAISGAVPAEELAFMME
jgi:hypothetical protein